MAKCIWVGKPNTTGRLLTLKADATSTPEEWANKYRQAHPDCLARVVSKPGMKSLEKWTYDSVCKSVGGKTVEPDGYDTEGYPSWLLVLGFI